MTDLYQEELMDLYKNPLNKKSLTKADVRYKIHNPLCGDTIELSLKFDSKNRVTEIGWQGEGCSISQVGASLLSEHVKGKSKAELKKLTSEEVMQLLGLQLNPTRLRCLLLTFEALQKSLDC